jgi:hypothetical protein
VNLRSIGWPLASVVATLLVGCGDDNDRLLDAGAEDLGAIDAPATDLGVADAGAIDTGIDVAVDRGASLDVTRDSGSEASTDAGSIDSGSSDVPLADVIAPDATMDSGAADRPDVGADAGPSDAGTTDVPRVDAASADAGSSDAGTSDAGAADAGSARGTPVIDGVIGSDWPAGAIVVSNTVPSAWGPTLNALRSIRVAWDGSRLYLGLEGVVEASNAMLVFIDRDYLPSMSATGVTAISTLTDSVGSLDNSISCNVTEAPTGFGTDMVWGTRGMLMKTSAAALDPAIGLRDVGCPTCRGDFRWTPGDTAVCVGGATPACEVAIEWSALYGSAPPPVPMLGLFVRITDAEGMSLSNNQCLPQQAAGDPPTAARRVLAFSPDR